MWHILCVPTSPQALHGSRGPGPGWDFGKCLPCTPVPGKGHSQNHVLPAPLWRGSIQKTIHRLGKAPQRHSQSPGAPRGSQTRARLLLPPSTAKPRWGHRAQGPHGLSRSLWSIPVLPRRWQVLGSRIHLTDRADPSSPVSSVLTLPPPSPLQMLPVPPVSAQRAPGPHPAHPPSPSPPSVSTGR